MDDHGIAGFPIEVAAKEIAALGILNRNRTAPKEQVAQGDVFLYQRGEVLCNPAVGCGPALGEKLVKAGIALKTDGGEAVLQLCDFKGGYSDGFRCRRIAGISGD